MLVVVKKKWIKVMDEAKIALTKEKNGRPVVIVIDEIDSVAIKNPVYSPSSMDEVNGILTMIDNVKRDNQNIIFIGITNYPHVLDPALKRSGRLGRQIEIPYPTKEEVAKMFGYLEKEIKGEKKDAYKYEGNKEKWNKEKWNKEKTVEWTNDFWPNALQITQEAFEKCKQEEVGISYTDLEMAIKDSLAKKVSKDSQKITPRSDDYKTELEKMVNNKIGSKPKKRKKEETPTPEKDK
jgi:SpoVK/Ycf46/Vps4 family AAA+-type ATPase